MTTLLTPDSGGLTQREVVVTAHELPLHCPTPSVKLWNAHPKVFLDVTKNGQAQCPYCGTRYRFEGPLPTGH